MKRALRLLLYVVYLSLTAVGLTIAVAGIQQLSPWPGIGMIVLSSACGYAVSGYVRSRRALLGLIAAAAAVILTVVLLPYGRWNYLLGVLNAVCAIWGARHDWAEEDTYLIDVRQLPVGIMVSIIGYCVAMLNLCDPAKLQIGYTLYVYLVLSVILINRKSVRRNAGGQAGRMMRGNQILSWVFIGILSFIVFLQPLQSAVSRGTQQLIHYLFSLFDRSHEIETQSPTGGGGGDEMNLGALGGPGKEWPQWLQVVGDIVLYAVTIAGILAILAFVGWAFYEIGGKLYKRLRVWMASFSAYSSEDYAEESEQLMSAQSMSKQLREDVARRVKKMFERPVRWGALSPAERVRHVFQRMLEQEKRVLSTAENLTPLELCARTSKDEQFAALYDRARYSDGEVTEEEAEKYREYLKS